MSQHLYNAYILQTLEIETTTLSSLEYISMLFHERLTARRKKREQQQQTPFSQDVLTALLSACSTRPEDNTAFGWTEYVPTLAGVMATKKLDEETVALVESFDAVARHAERNNGCCPKEFVSRVEGCLQSKSVIVSLPKGVLEGLRRRMRSVTFWTRLSAVMSGEWDAASAIGVWNWYDASMNNGKDDDDLLLTGSQERVLQDLNVCIRAHQEVVKVMQQSDREETHTREVIAQLRKRIDPVHPSWTATILRPLDQDLQRQRTLLSLGGGNHNNNTATTVKTTQQPDTSFEHIVRELHNIAQSAHTMATDTIFEVISSVNVWLRVQGLHRVSSYHKDGVTGKVVPELAPTSGTQHDVFIPHHCNEVWSKELSVLYEQCCLQYQLRQRCDSVVRELHTTLALSDEDFVKAAVNSDLFMKIFETCDEVCISSGERVILESRVDQLLRARLKVYHPSGDIRVLTVSQRVPFSTVLLQIALLFPEGPSPHGMQIKYVDSDGDKVRISRESDWVECLRQKRGTALMTYTMRSTVNTPSSAGEASISLFMEVSNHNANTNTHNNSTPMRPPPPPMEAPATGPPVVKRTSSWSQSSPSTPPAHQVLTRTPTAPRSLWGGPQPALELARHLGMSQKDTTSTSLAESVVVSSSVVQREIQSKKVLDEYVNARNDKALLAQQQEIRRKLEAELDKEDEQTQQPQPQQQQQGPPRKQWTMPVNNNNNNNKVNNTNSNNGSSNHGHHQQLSKWRAPYRRSGVELNVSKK